MNCLLDSHTHPEDHRDPMPGDERFLRACGVRPPDVRDELRMLDLTYRRDRYQSNGISEIILTPVPGRNIFLAGLGVSIIQDPDGNMSPSGECGLSQLFFRKSSLFCLFARLYSHVADSKVDADLPQEVIGRGTAGKDPYKVVGGFLHAAVDRENDGIRFEFYRIRFKQDFDFP